MSENNSNQTTSLLIRKLTQDLSHPSESKHWPVRYWSSWWGWFGILGFLTFIATQAFPEFAHLPSRLDQPAFWVETALWFLASFTCAWTAYQSSFPMGLRRFPQRAATLLFLSLVGWTLTRWTPSVFASELREELDPSVGKCGYFILLTGTFSMAWMFYSMRRAAPTRAIVTGAWSAAAAGCVGSMFMHVVCRHENSVHLVLWHFLPVLILSLIGAQLGKQKLILARH